MTLLVPAGARIVDDGLRWFGRGRLNDRGGADSPTGKVIRLRGEVRSGEIRVRRGGTAVLSLVRHGKAADVRRAYADGRLGDGRSRR